MKKCLIALLCLCYLHSHAQTALAVSGGYNFSRFSPGRTQPSSYFMTNTSFVGDFQGGILVMTAVKSGFFIQYGAFINTNGSYLNVTDRGGDTISRNIVVLYAQMPVNLIYNWKLNKHDYFYAGAGVYGAKALWGEEYGHEYELNAGPYQISENIKFSNHNAGYIVPTVIKPFDFGYDLLAGYACKKLCLEFTFAHGITPVLPSPSVYRTNYQNEILSLSVGYLICKIR